MCPRWGARCSGQARSCTAPVPAMCMEILRRNPCDCFCLSIQYQLISFITIFSHFVFLLLLMLTYNIIKQTKRRKTWFSPRVYAFDLSPRCPAGHSPRASWVDTRGAAAASTSWEPQPVLAAPEWSPSPMPSAPRPSCSRFPAPARQGTVQSKWFHSDDVGNFNVSLFTHTHIHTHTHKHKPPPPGIHINTNAPPHWFLMYNWQVQNCFAVMMPFLCL